MSKKFVFETAFNRLEEISQQLSSNGVSLDDTLVLVEEGMKLVKECSKKLNSAEKRVLKLTENSDGSVDETEM